MACCERVFPDPDPMMRFIDPDEGPNRFWAFIPQERSRRARHYLVCLAAGEEPLMAWLAAISTEPEDERLIHEVVDVNCGPENGGDAKIEAMLADLQRRGTQVPLPGTRVVPSESDD